MPIFEYECKSCEEIYEKVIIYGRPEIIACPNCGSRSRKKLMSRVNSPWNRRDLDDGFKELDLKKRRARTSRGRGGSKDPDNVG